MKRTVETHSEGSKANVIYSGVEPKAPGALDFGLVMAAHTLGGSVNVSLLSIITTLVDAYVRAYHLLPEEFFQKFRRNGISRIIVDAFVDTLTESENKIDRVIDHVRAKIKRLRTMQFPKTENELTELLLPLKELDLILGSLRSILEKPTKHPVRKKTNQLGRNEFLEAQDEVRKFVQNYAALHDQGTLSSLLDRLKARYPAINFNEIFDEEIKKSLAQQIDIATKGIIQDEFEKLFESDAENYTDEDRIEENDSADTRETKRKRQKRQNFILSYIFNRCIKIRKDGKIDINSKKLEQFIEFLDLHKYPIECLYMLVYARLSNLRDVEKPISAQRIKTRKSTCAAGVLEPVLEPPKEAVATGNDTPYKNLMDTYDEFFAKYFIPVIQNIRGCKLPNRRYLRPVDTIKINPGDMAISVLPGKAIEPIVKIAELDPAEYMRWLRGYFNYGHPLRGRLADRDINKSMARQLRLVKKQIQYIIKSAMTMKAADDPTRTDCQFINEILNCQNLRELILWFAKPEEFIKQYPGHKDVPLKIIQHQARRMFEMLLFYRQHAFDPTYKQSHKNRKNIEEYLKEELHLTELKQVRVRFRIGVLINKDTQEPVYSTNGKGEMPVYKVFKNKHHSILQDRPEQEIIVPEGGKTYKVYPVEVKDFIKTKAKIPYGNGSKEKNQEHTEATLLWYSGDDNLIHCKGLTSYISKCLRGGTTRDGIRGAVTGSAVNLRALKEFLYDHCSSGDKSPAIVDRREKRNVNPNKETTRTRGSHAVVQSQVFTGQFSLTIATKRMKKSKQKPAASYIDHQHAPFELQLDNLDNTLINLSDYTIRSHGRAYTPAREWRNLFGYLFPPVVYGRKFAEHQRQGYEGHSS